MTPTGYFLEHLWLIPLFPLVTAGLMLLIGRRVPNIGVSVLCVGSVGLSFIYALGAVTQLLAAEPEHRVAQQILFEWLTPGPMQAAGHTVRFVADWGYLLDPLSCVMVLVVTGVGFLIHVYSIGYMGHEGGYYRFFGYMNLFMFAMLTLVLANNMLLMFVGWEGVGLCSYLLIGFYFLKKSAADAGKKAFIVNRIGDAGFILGILWVAVTFGTIRFTTQGLSDAAAASSGIRQALEAAASSGTLAMLAPTMTAIALLLFVGAAGKSAQIPLYVWLPDAMEGPTPVSALIHAATMVTAGVYMVVRMNAIYQLSPFAMDVVAVIGAVTAIFAASMALVQCDIKKVLAYSTISQLGYMFLALGVGAFSAGIFHLMTHAFFKALLFLGAGSVIHAMSGEQDVQKMGGLWNKIPITSRTFAIATLAISGIFPFAGFFSKDEILGGAFDRFLGMWIVGFITAGITAFYMSRLFFVTFIGYSRADDHVVKHIHESPYTMTGPLMILAVLSVIGGWIGWPGSLGGENRFERFLEPIVAGILPETEAVKIAHHARLTEYALMGASLLIACLGIWLAYEFYCSKRIAPEIIAAKFPPLYKLLFHKYYVDEIYDAAIVNRVKDLGTGLGVFDAKVIDGLGVDGAGWLARFSSTLSMWWDKWIIDGLLNLGAKVTQLTSYPIRLLQTGAFSSYALLILFGLVVLLGYYGHHIQVLLRGGR